MHAWGSCSPRSRERRRALRRLPDEPARLGTQPGARSHFPKRQGTGMNRIDPDQLAAIVRELHGYSLDAVGAARAAELIPGIAAAVAALAPDPQFHEEPANFAL